MIRALVITGGQRVPMRTLPHLTGFSVTAVTNSRAGANNLRSAHPDLPVVVSGIPGGTCGKVQQVEWAIAELTEPGEWVLIADDNIERITGLPGEYDETEEFPEHDDYSLYALPVSPSRLYDRCVAAIALAQSRGAWLVGFGTTSNGFFRRRHYRDVGFVYGKMLLWRSDPGFRFDPTIGTIDDFRNTAEHTLRYGRVLIDNYLYPVARSYAAGGIGKLAERMPARLSDIQKVMTDYPGFFRLKQRPGWPEGSDLRLAITTIAQAERWRASMGAGPNPH